MFWLPSLYRCQIFGVYATQSATGAGKRPVVPVENVARA